ncbi:hypothetical protein L208DRAFT_1376953 [Tricholoma matsutake]|nr:hypothetical protein L208DRAFT_1376953 [Tricholoma matsutake 945]
MAALIKEEGLDKDGHPMKCLIPCHHHQKCKCKQTKKTIQEDRDDDDDDSDFLSSGFGDESSSESDSNRSDNMILNDEIADMLPLKTGPSNKSTKSTTCLQQMNSTSASKSMTHAKKKSCKVTVEEVEDKDSPQNVSVCNCAASPDQSTTHAKKKSCKATVEEVEDRDSP